jgi:hypothetical protein
MNPLTKKYSDTELQSSPLIRVRFVTAGIDNPEGEYLNEEGACPICKSNRLLVHPLIIPTNRIGKKKIDFNLRYGFLVLDKRLIEELKAAGLTGLESHSISLGKNHIDFNLLSIKNTLPKMSDQSSVHKYQICPNCGRSGHYDNYEIETRFKYHYLDIKDLKADFFKTWEYFGIWDMGQNFQEIIISQKAYKMLKQQKLRHLKFEPIEIIK